MACTGTYALLLRDGDNLHLLGGTMLVGLGFTLFVVHPVFWRLPGRWQPKPGSLVEHWQSREDQLAAMLRFRPLRFGMTPGN